MTIITRNKLAALVAVLALSVGLAACGGGSSNKGDDQGTGPTLEELQTQQRMAIKSAISAAETAVAAVDNDSTDADVSAADAAVAAVNTAIAAAADLPAAETAANSVTATVLASQLSTAKKARQTAMSDAQKAANAAMAAKAVLLYGGIGANPLTGHAVSIAAGTGVLTVNPAGDPAPEQALTADKKTMVAANHGWEGKRHTASGTGVTGTYEAFVYSNVGEPTEGEKFSTQYTDSITSGVLNEDTTEGTASRVASSSFDQSAGVKSFKKGSNDIAVMIPGTYHGVSGTYSCVPGDNSTCASQVAAEGFNLGGVTSTNVFSADNAAWTFKPTNADAKVMSTPDTIYASYGWWVHTSADGTTVIASAFATDRGEVTNAAGIEGLRGTATYTGGAAGQYALKSSTGGTNDAGHFTAKATLNADFNDDTITGTIDNFMGADGKSRDWSVELKEATIADGGGISRTAADDTVWTIGGNAAGASGVWAGSLQDNGADGVPKVGSGTFHSTYGGDGRMVGAFGVTKQ